MFHPRDVAAAFERGVFWIDEHAIEQPLCAALTAELDALERAGQLQTAGVGRAERYRRDLGLRGDRIAWLTSATAPQRQFLKEAERLRITLNRRMFLGLNGLEAHFARYDAGARYGRHVDSFVGSSNRVVSMVAYLNADWQPSDGGELVLYAADTEHECVRIAPRAGTAVAFLSEQVPHEVLRAAKPRNSIAAWFRRR